MAINKASIALNIARRLRKALGGSVTRRDGSTTSDRVVASEHWLDHPIEQYIREDHSRPQPMLLGPTRPARAAGGSVERDRSSRFHRSMQQTRDRWEAEGHRSNSGSDRSQPLGPSNEWDVDPSRTGPEDRGGFRWMRRTQAYARGGEVDEGFPDLSKIPPVTSREMEFLRNYDYQNDEEPEERIRLAGPIDAIARATKRALKHYEPLDPNQGVDRVPEILKPKQRSSSDELSTVRTHRSSTRTPEEIDEIKKELRAPIPPYGPSRTLVGELPPLSDAERKALRGNLKEGIIPSERIDRHFSRGYRASDYPPEGHSKIMGEDYRAPSSDDFKEALDRLPSSSNPYQNFAAHQGRLERKEAESWPRTDIEFTKSPGRSSDVEVEQGLRNMWEHHGEGPKSPYDLDKAREDARLENYLRKRGMNPEDTDLFPKGLDPNIDLNLDFALPPSRGGARRSPEQTIYKDADNIPSESIPGEGPAGFGSPGEAILKPQGTKSQRVEMSDVVKDPDVLDEFGSPKKFVVKELSRPRPERLSPESMANDLRRAEYKERKQRSAFIRRMKEKYPNFAERIGKNPEVAEGIREIEQSAFKERAAPAMEEWQQQAAKAKEDWETSAVPKARRAWERDRAAGKTREPAPLEYPHRGERGLEGLPAPVSMNWRNRPLERASATPSEFQEPRFEPPPRPNVAGIGHNRGPQMAEDVAGPTVRLWYGGMKGEPTAGSMFTSDRKEAYKYSSSGRKLYYLDVPKSHDSLKGISGEKIKIKAPRSLVDRASIFKDEDKYARGGRALSRIERAARIAKKYASGGKLEDFPGLGDVDSHIPHSGGLLKSTIPGRTDKLPIRVKSGSYIIPADILSSSKLGEGNTDAGAKALDTMLAPHRGMPGMGRRRFRSGLRKPRGFADGGNTEEIPIVAAGGEYAVEPEAIESIGGGDMTKGHNTLDAFVKKVRRHNIKTLRSLPSPKKN